MFVGKESHFFTTVFKNSRLTKFFYSEQATQSPLIDGLV